MIPRGFDPPAVSLPSLGRCILGGQGTTSLIRFLAVPTSASVFLLRPHIDTSAIFPKFDDLSAAPGLRVLENISSVVISISDDAVRLQAKNDHGGALEVEVDELCDLSRDPAIFVHFIRSSFESARTCPGFKTARVFTLSVERGSVWEPEEATCFALDVMGFVFKLPDIEEVKLRGVPTLELSSILEFLHSAAKFELPCPNLRRLDIESIPLRSPRSLLKELGKLLAERKEAGAPFQSVMVKVKCEMLVPFTDHCAFLASWGGLVGGARLEYEKAEVKELPRRRRRNYENEDEWDSEEDEWDCEYGYEGEDDKGEDGDGDIGGDEEANADDADGDCVGWDKWSEEWPKVVGEMEEQ